MLKCLCRQRQGAKSYEKYTISYEFTKIDFEAKKIVCDTKGIAYVYAENDFEAGYEVSRRDLGRSVHNLRIVNVKELAPHKVVYTSWTGDNEVEVERIAYGDIEDIKRQIICNMNQYNVRIID